jgi:hypothetical protein
VNHSILNLRAALIAAVTTVLFSSQASAQQWAINKPGSYKLYANQTVTSGDGIVITASNVTLDLNGFATRSSTSPTTTAPAPGPTATRGILIQGAKNVEIKNGHIGGYNVNVSILDSENVRVNGLQITGGNLAPSGGPTEVAIMLVNSYACDVQLNTLSSTNLGIFVRGGKSTGNRFMKNMLVGGAVAANNLLGICYNPGPVPAGAPADPAGPRGDSIYNNHIARYGYSIAVSTGSVSNMFTGNTLASFTGAFREPQNFTALGGTNVEFDNTAVTIPTTGL